MIEGKLKVFATSGGIKLDDNDKWINPNPEVKKMISAGEIDVEGMKKLIGKRVALEMDNKGLWFGIQPHLDDMDEELPQEIIKENKPSNFVINFRGKEYVTHQGLLNEAHKKGLISIETELIVGPSEDGLIVFKATAKTKDKTFTCYGDASKNNVNSMIVPHVMRMAETRAINRTLRLLTNIGMTSIEELGEKGDEE